MKRWIMLSVLALLLLLLIFLRETQQLSSLAFWLLMAIGTVMGGMAIQFIYTYHAAQKNAEEKIYKANRLYFFISQINQMIVRTTEEEQLFVQACHIAVDYGSFKMAWIGLIDSETQQLVPVAHRGDEKGYLTNIRIVVNNEELPEGRGPSAKSIKEAKSIFCNDISTDPRMAPWKTEALKRGYQSSVSIPIKKKGIPIGCFTLYASTKNFFDITEISLLEDAAGDISFAIENIEREKLRRKAEEALLQSNKKYQTFTESSPVGVFHTDKTGFTTYVNPKWCEISGLTFEEALGNGWLGAVHEADRERIQQHWAVATSSNNKDSRSESEYRFVRPDGSIACVIGQAIPEMNTENEVIGYIGTITDITDHKKAEEAIRKEKYLSDSIINSLPGVFYLYTNNGKFLRWNENFSKVTGYTNQEIAHMHPLDFFPENETGLLTERINKVFDVGEASVQANFLLKNKNTVPFYFTGSSVEYEGQQCLMGVGIDFSERVRAQEIIKETSEELRDLTAHLLHIREEERKRIGREIHDELGQQVTAIKMDIAWINKKMPEELVAIKSKIKNINELLDGSNLSIRRILSELKPGILDNNNLLDAMNWHAKQFTANTGIPVELTTNNINAAPDEKTATCLFRVFQEALTNITRYAKAKNVFASLQTGGGMYTLLVQDDGIGFDVSNKKDRKTFGILGMRERLHALGGSLELITSPGSGTKIIATIPFNE